MTESANSRMARRATAFAAAARHSGRVRLARRTLIIGATVAVVAVAVLSLFNPFRVLPKGLDLGKVGLDGTKVTIANPRLTGFRKDGRAYSVSAASGVQDIKTPNIMNLTGIDAIIAMADKTHADVLAPFGVYDSGKDTMDMSGAITLKNDSGYNLAMQGASVNFKAGTLMSQNAVRLTMQTGSVDADTITVSNNGQQISFAGHVEAVMLPTPQKEGQP